MRLSGKIKLLLCLLVCGTAGFSQTISNKGKEFWVGYGHHQFMEDGSNTQNMTIYLSAEEQPATVTLTIDSSGVGGILTTWWRRTYNIPAFTVISIEDNGAASYTTSAGPIGPIPKGNGGYDARLYTDPPPAGTGGAGLFRKKSIHIESNVPIVAYAHIYGSAASGATMLLPVEAWGYSYVSLNSKQDYASNCYNWMYVIASKDNTIIEITPSVKTRAQDKTGLAPGVSRYVTLMKGQIYQIIGANTGSDANGNGGTASTGYELSGTKVKSIASAGECYPIAVFAGSSRTSNPASCGEGGGDNDNQQLFPQHAWGKRYLTAPFSGSSSASSFGTSTFKVAIKDPGTVVKRNGTILTGITNGFYTFESNTADYIEADKPIMVTQFMTGGGCLGSGGLGDPEMVVVSPVEQAIKQIGFYRNTKESISVNYVTLIVPTAGVASLRIDNSSAFDYTYPHPNLNGYTVVVKRWTAAKAQALIKCDSAFNSITYGLGSVESYAYSGGAYINNLNAVSNIHNEPDTSNGGTKTHTFTCVNTPIKLSVLMRYQPIKLVWKLSALSAVLTPSADVTMDPASNYFTDSLVVNGVKYYRYTLPGTYTFNTAGIHSISIRSTSLSVDNCNNQEDLQISVEVKGKPIVDFSVVHPTRCTADTAYFNGPLKTAGSDTISVWKWTFPGGVTDSVQNSKQLFAPGTYTAKLYVASIYGCAADTTKSFTVVPRPTATFGAAPSTVCLGQPITFSDTSAYTGPTAINGYYWSFGNGVDTTATTSTNFVINYANPNTYTVKHVVKVSALCVSDTAIKTVKVSPKAVIAFSYPTNCLPASGLAQFSASATDLGGQPITSYAWNFGDANAPVGQNTSNAQNPSHTYTVPGSYTVTLGVVTNTGCSGDTSVVISMNVRASMTYGALRPVCMNSGSIKIDSAKVTNNVPGGGYYSGAGTDSAGNFNPAVAGAGTHTIYYVFTTTGNCTDTVSSSIVVYPVPAKPVVTRPVNYCQNATATALVGTAAAGSTLAWFTNASLTGGTATAPTPNTATAGTTNYYVNQTSANGCISDTSIITVNVTPVISGNTVGTDQSICSSDTVASLTATGTIAGGTGTYTYQWQISTDGGATWTDIAGATSAGYVPGTSPGIRKFRRTVSSGLCSDISNIVTIAVATTITNADISGTQVVCAGTAPALLDGQTATGGTITYQWQSSVDGTTWSDINGATSEDYQPSPLSGTTYYRRIASNGACPTTSSVVTVTVNPQPNATITGPAAICVYDAAAVSVSPSGGTAPYNVVLTVTGPGGPSTITQSITGTTSIQAIAANSAAGNYSITISSITDSKGCIKNTGFTPVTVTVNPKPVLTVSANTAICAGTSTTLTVSGATNYTWSPATGLNTTSGSSVVANPAATTTYTVNGSANSCNADPASVMVTVNALPAKPTVTRPVAYCQNDVSVALSATASGTNTLTWYNNASLTGGSSTAPTPSTAAAGTFNYYVTQTNAATTCVSDTANISVTIYPSIASNTISGNQTLCAGEAAASIGAAGNPTGGNSTYTYQWQQSTDNGVTWTNIAAATSASYSPGVLTGVLQYRRVVTSGLCANTSNVVTITVLAAIANSDISGTQTICAGSAPAILVGQAASGGGTITYQWESSADGITFTSISGATGKDYQPVTSNATTYYRRIVSNGVCSATSSVVKVTVNAKPAGTISGATAMCVYDSGFVSFASSAGVAPFSLQLSVNGPGGSYPVSQPGVVSGTSLKVIPANSPAGIYTVTISSITDNNGCTSSTGFTPVVITVNAKPVVTLTPNAAICAGSSTQITASGATTYSWSPSAGLSATSGSTVTANPSATTVYTVKGSSNGCVADPVSVTITVNNIPAKPSATRPVAYCENETAVALTATASAGNTLTWYGNASLTGGNSVAPTPSTSVTGTTYYYVTQTNTASGCVSDTTAIPVTINALPVPNFQLPGAICMINGQGVAQFTNQSNAQAGATYTWNFGDGSSTSSAVNPVHTYTSAGPFNVNLKVTSLQGCSKDTTKRLSSFYQKPIAGFVVSPDTLCQGTASDFSDLSTAPGSNIQTWKWWFGDGSTSAEQSPTKVYAFPGTYKVKLTVRSTEGCQSDTLTKNVVVYLQPVVEAGPAFVVPQGTPIQLSASVKDSTNLSYLWTPALALSDATVLRPTLIANTDQVYKITATGPGQCTASDTVSVKVLLPVVIPNAFSPNGDGINDKWRLDNLKEYPGCTVEIYNRYGQQVFRSQGYAQPWDGTLNGKVLPVGVYYYIIDLKNGFKQISGNVTVLK